MRMRVISDNDYSGDPDGLVQLAQHALSSSVDLRVVIGSHLTSAGELVASDRSADEAAAAARTVLGLAGRPGVPVVAGSNTGLVDRATPIASAATEAIVAEAMRDDSRPLYVCLGAGLTELASACLIEPRIASRLTAVWIGGAEYPGTVPAPPGAGPAEYNTTIDPLAAQVVVNDLDVPLWQVPRDAYRQCAASMAELELAMGRAGDLGAHLYGELRRVTDLVRDFGIDLGETYVLGDSPLVLLTALQSGFEVDASSSDSVVRPAPVLAGDGSYTGETLPARPVRVFTRIDTRLMLADLYAKLALFQHAPSV
jgi:purine nucleosidase